RRAVFALGATRQSCDAPASSMAGGPASTGGRGGPASVGGQTRLVRSALLLPRSFTILCRPAGSVTVVPVRKGDRIAWPPGFRGVICRNVVLTSGPWHPLHVLSDA